MADIELVIKISEEDYFECVKRVKEIREKGYMIENSKYKIIIANGTPLELEERKREAYYLNRILSKQKKELEKQIKKLEMAEIRINKKLSELKGK